MRTLVPNEMLKNPAVSILSAPSVAGPLTVNGSLMLSQDPSANLEAATKQYVDTKVGSGAGAYLPLAGGTLTGPLLFTPDNTVDVGASGATRMRDLFVGRNAVFGGTVTTATVGPQSGALNLRSAASIRWQIDANGHLMAASDNSFDIGAAAATRPRNVFLAGYEQQAEIAKPANPAAGQVRIYPKSDHHLYILDSTGAETDLATTGLTQAQSDALYLPLTGGTLSGMLTANGGIAGGSAVTNLSISANYNNLLLSAPSDVVITAAGQGWRVSGGAVGTWQPNTDNGQDIGGVANRVRTVYAATSVITPMVGSNSVLNFSPYLVARWQIDSTGALLPLTDNAYDLGEVPGYRVRDLLLGRNLVLSGSGRILGDFSNAAMGSRTLVQSSTLNGNTEVVVLPNGTSRSAFAVLLNNPDTANYSALYIGVDATKAYVSAAATGTGAQLPIMFGTTNGTERMRLLAAGGMTMSLAGGNAPTYTPIMALSTPTNVVGAGVFIRLATGSGYSTSIGIVQDTWWHAFGDSTGAVQWGFDGAFLKLAADIVWHTVTYQNGFSAQTGWGDCQYTRTPDGMVRFRGLLMSPASGWGHGIPAFTLPAGYRIAIEPGSPTGYHHFLCLSDSALTGGVTILSNGIFSPWMASGGATSGVHWWDLSALSYLAW